MRRLLATAAILALAAAPAAAQGKVKKGGKSGPATAGSSSAPSRPFGSWLDDASLLDPGAASGSISIGHYRMAGGHQTDFPIADASVGATPTLQFGGSVPYYHMTLDNGSNAGGMGDVSLHAKFALLDPSRTKSRFGTAFTTVLEILDQPPAGASRFGWAVPLDLEYRADGFRVYGSTGYFSRGALFASGALEVPITDRVTATGVLALMKSTQNNPAADRLHVPGSRRDATGLLSYFASPSVALFVSAGRTIASNDPTATSLMISGGMSINVRAAALP